MTITELKTLIKKRPDGNYEQIKRNGDYEVMEYKTPNGNVGYQIFLYKTVDGVDYVRCSGYGVESKSRTFNWSEIKEK